jgi:hypothetical protein
MWVFGGIRKQIASMPVPTVLLREFQQEMISDWIPGTHVLTYEVCDLVT